MFSVNNTEMSGHYKDPSTLSIAPMIQWTDRHYRFLMRQITKKSLLYTEMTMDTALIHNYDPPSRLEPFIGHDSTEYPLAIQLGGKNPESIAKATQICESYGEYHEINLNSGCPSKTAKSVGFGAELMWEHPDKIREIVYGMNRVATKTEITVKCRIGTTPGRSASQCEADGYDWNDLLKYIDAIRSAGTRKIIVHARTCVLRGLSPAQNRTIPPLQYDVVYRLIRAFPDMKFVINGGIQSLDTVEHLLAGTCRDHHYLYDHVRSASPSESASAGTVSGAGAVSESGSEPVAVHGCMVGREAYNNPWLFSTADERFFFDSSSAGRGTDDLGSDSVGDDGDRPRPRCRRDVLESYLNYAVRMQDAGAFGSNTPNILKPLHNFFSGCFSYGLAAVEAAAEGGGEQEATSGSGCNAADGGGRRKRDFSQQQGETEADDETAATTGEQQQRYQHRQRQQQQHLMPLYDINGPEAKMGKDSGYLIVSHSRQYKNKLDSLVKRHTPAHKTGSSHVGRGSSDITLRDLVMSAVDGTIPDWFLDSV